MNAPKGIIGPWSHNWPDEAVPGPNIGFLDECLQFWNTHLKGEPEKKSPKFVWFQCQGSIPPGPLVENWPGVWCAKEDSNPQQSKDLYLSKNFELSEFENEAFEALIDYDANAGWTCGEMLSFGGPDLPGEQVNLNYLVQKFTTRRLLKLKSLH